MARKFYTPIDLTGLELSNAKIQNLASDPSAYGKGHLYFNTVHNELRVYDGTQWVAVGGSIEYGNTLSRPAAGNEGRVYADTQAGTIYVDNGTTWDQVAEFAGAVSAHNSNTSGVHGVTGDVVGTTDTQNLSNKTILGPLYVKSGGGAGGTSNTIDTDNTAGTFKISSSSYDIALTSADQIILKPKVDIVDGSDVSKFTLNATSGVFTLDEWAYLELKDGSNVLGGDIYLDGNFYISSYNANALHLTGNTSLDLYSNDGDINLNPDGIVKVHGSLTASYDLRVGGQDSTDGYLYVQQADGTETFKVDSAGEYARLRGSFEMYTGGTKFFTITVDGGNAAVLNGYNSDLILTSDSSNVYLNSNGSEGYKLVDKAYVDGLVTGLTWKPAANLLADSNIALTGSSGTLTIDSHTALGNSDDGYRILLTGQ